MKNLLLTILLIFCFWYATAQENNTPGEMVEDFNTRIIKFYFFSPLAGHLSLGYEQQILPGISINGKVGIIGIGFNEDKRARGGILLKAGPKFMLGQDFYIPGMRDVHPLRGTYFRPEIAYSGYNYRMTETSGFGVTRISNETQFIHSGAILLNLGRQIIIQDMISIDIYVGAGYALAGYVTDTLHDPWSNTKTIISYNVPRRYAFYTGAPEYPFAITTGFSLGVLF